MTNKSNYQVVDFTPKQKSHSQDDYMDYQNFDYRYAIADATGKIIDDAQGYGYKSRQKAHIAISYKYQGGKQKANQRKADYNKWLKENPVHASIVDEFNDQIMWCFKEIARGETTQKEIWDELKKEYAIEIPAFIMKEALTSH